MRALLITLTTCLLVVPANAKYSGGTGEPNDPYRIATAADLIALGNEPNDYGKHFILTADIDLDPNLPGRRVFDKAVIGSHEPAFTGVLDGKGHRISHLTIQGGSYLGLFGYLEAGAEVKNLIVSDVNITGSGVYVGGLVGRNGLWGTPGCTVTNCCSTGTVSGEYAIAGLVGYNCGSITTSYSSGAVNGNSYVGGLVGENQCRVTMTYSSGTVSGTDDVGGLVGWNHGTIASSYSTGAVSGKSRVGGLVGGNEFNDDMGWVGSITTSYSTGAVSGTERVGGLVGYNWEGVVSACFWDIRSSGQSTSAGGTGKTTAEMQMASTFLGWGCTPPVWTVDEGVDCPRLAWEGKHGEAFPVLADFIAGSGSQADPYLIRTADDLDTIGLFLWEWDKHFKLTADIDMSGFDGKDGRPAFNIIGKSGANDFTGIFDGNGHTISDVTIKGVRNLGLFGQLFFGAVVKDLGVVDANITGSGDNVGGLVGLNWGGDVTWCYSTGAVNGEAYVGGLVGWNPLGIVASSFSAAFVRGNHSVGGLVGLNDDAVTQCYSTGAVSGGSSVGGLVGVNEVGTITTSYSTGAVNGTSTNVGGLVGYNRLGSITRSFWDIQTSGQPTSCGGTGKTTADMQTASTFLKAGWDFVGETANGTEDTWWIDEGKDYPRFVWEQGQARLSYPQDGAVDVAQPVTLRWRPGGLTMHDVYFGEDEETVANAMPETLDVYRGRQPAEMTTYDPGTLKSDKTYYWRVDEVNEADPSAVWKGEVWSFTTGDFVLVLVIDDFESYTDVAGRVIFQTWTPVAQAWVGNLQAPWAEQTVVHAGHQSMPFLYSNVIEPWYSEAERTWATPQDWTIADADTLTLYFRGDPNNSPEPLYVGLEDGAGQIAVVVHPDAEAVLATEWQKWHIALADVRVAGVDVAAVKKMVIGVGDRKNPKPGGTGRIYIDDIRLTKRMP